MATYDELMELYKPKKNWANVIQEGLGAVSAGMQGKPYTPPGSEDAIGSKDLIKAMLLEDIKTKSDLQKQQQMEDYKAKLETDRLRAIGILPPEGTSGVESQTPGGFRPKSFTSGGVSFERQPTEEEESKKLVQEVSKKELMEMTKNLPKLDQAFTAIESLKEQFNKAYAPESVKTGDIKGGLAQRLRGLGARSGAAIGSDPQLQAYLNDRNAFAGLISKGGFGEAGMLTNQDIQRVVKSLPAPGDTLEEATAKWQLVENLLSSARRRYEGKLKQVSSGKMMSDGNIHEKNTETPESRYQKYLNIVGGNNALN